MTSPHMTTIKVPVGLRLVSMLLDHAIVIFALVPLLILAGMIFGSNERFKPDPVDNIGFFIIALVYLNKDFIGGRSIAKRLLGFKIVDRKTGKPANELKCFLRKYDGPDMAI